MKIYLTLSHLIICAFVAPEGDTSDEYEVVGITQILKGNRRKHRQIMISTQIINDEFQKNVEAEKMILRRQLRFIDGPPREETLLQMLANEKVQSRKEIKKLGRYEESLQGLRSFIRRYACPFKLRYIIEFRLKRYIQSHEESRRRQIEVHKKITQLMDHTSRIKYLKNIINVFTISKENFTVVDKDFERAWNMLINITYGLPKLILISPNNNINQLEDVTILMSPTTTGSQTTTDSPTTSLYLWTITIHPSNMSELATKLIELYEAPNLKKAKEVYNTQQSFWQYRRGVNDDIEIKHFLCSIPFKIILLQGSNNFFTNDEMNYAEDIVKTGEISNPKRSKYYEQCLWIFHISHHNDIDMIKQKMEEKWPFYDRAQRYHLYCSEYVHLYTIISGLEHHGPRTQVPPSCEPKEEDYKNYVTFLYNNVNETLGFVASTLCLADTNVVGTTTTRNPKRRILFRRWKGRRRNAF